MQLDPSLQEKAREVIASNPKITSAVLFGSRALGTADKTSDIDIALKGDISALDAESISRMLDDDLPTLLQFDVVAYGQINLPALRDHIDRVGIEIYRSNSTSQSSSPNTARA